MRSFLSLFLLLFLGLPGTVRSQLINPYALGAPPGPVTGSVLAAAVEADGYTLAVTLKGLNIGGTYADKLGLGAMNTPETGTPLVTLTVVDLGFDPVTTAANTVTRTIWGKGQKRRIYPNAASFDETFDGTNTTVRLVLSDPVFSKAKSGAGNSGTDITASFGAFYTYSGTAYPAGGTVTVANNSALNYSDFPVVANWTTPPDGRINASTFTRRVYGAHWSGRNGSPLAAVKFTATDTHGHTDTQIVNSLSIDGTYGDLVPVSEYIATHDSSTLTQGDLVTCNFIAYPWIGDAATCLDSSAGAAYPTPLAGPVARLNDKSNTYGASYAVVNPATADDTTGTVTTSSGGVQSPFKTLAGAYNAVRTYNNTNFTRNNCGGSTIYLRTGNHDWIGGTVTVGTTPDTYLTVTRHPSDARSGVIIASGSGGKSLGLKLLIRDVTITAQGTSGGTISAGAGSALWLDQCDINCPTPGSTATTFYLNSVWHVTRCNIIGLAQGIRNANATVASPGVVRGNNLDGVVGNGVISYVVVGNKRTANTVFGGLTDLGTNLPACVNNIVHCNFITSAVASAPILKFASTSTTVNTYGMVVSNNVFECTTNGVPCMQIAADGTLNWDVNNVIIANNTVLGERMSLAYNEIGAYLGVRKGWTLINNLSNDYNIKGDTFTGTSITSITRVGTTATLSQGNHGYLVGDTIYINGASPSVYTGAHTVLTVPTTGTLTYAITSDPGSNASPAGSLGAHPNRVGNWSFMYQVGCSGNMSMETVGVGAPGVFLWDIAGLNSYPTAVTGQPPQSASTALLYAKFVSPAYFDGVTNGAGNGDYHLQAGSPAIGLQRVSFLKYDITGATRSGSSAAGAYHYP